MLFIRSEVEPGEVVCHENQPYSCVHETEDPFFGFREVHPLLGDDQPHGCDGQKNEKEIVSAQGFFSVFEKKHAITLFRTGFPPCRPSFRLFPGHAGKQPFFRIDEKTLREV